MAASNPTNPTQEQSIKARKHQLFGADDDQVESAPRQSFAELLRTTPADPLSPTTKGILWVVGSLVILLLLAAFATVATRTRPRPKPAATVGLDRTQPWTHQVGGKIEVEGQGHPAPQEKFDRFRSPERLISAHPV